MDDIDDSTTLLSQLHDDDDTKKKNNQQQQLNLITKPFQNLNLVHEHGGKVGMVVTEEPYNKIPHVTQVFNLPDSDFEVTDVMRSQNPNNKSRPAHRLSRRIHNVSQVHEPQPKDVIGYRVPMTTKEEQDAWTKFQERAKRDNWAGRKCIRHYRDKVVLDHDEPIVQLLVRFAVDTYNAICMMACVSGGVCMTSILEFKYIKWGDHYVNYITIEAAAFGINCKYESLVHTVPSDGRKTLVNFHRARGWYPFDDINDNDALKRKHDPEEVARWNELKEDRNKFLKAVDADPPRGSGLLFDNVLGSYGYFNPLKEFKKMSL